MTTTHTDLKTRTDELRRQAWERAQTDKKPTPAQILANRTSTSSVQAIKTK
jgi:hypothetical protein